MASPLQDFPPDLTAAFEPLGVLGAGGMGLVFEARDRALDRRVALKLLRFSGPAGERRFAREATVLAGLRHPGVVRVYDHGRCLAGPYLVMELLEGPTLERVPAGPPALAALGDVAGALAELHARDLLHRDVKPGNVILAGGERGVLVDFGLAYDPRRSRVTPTGQVLGTLVYMAPALLRGAEATPAADWFGWAATAFRVLEGRPPRPGEDLLAWLAGRRELPPLGWTSRPPGDPARERLEAMLALDPTTPPGPGDARVVLEALGAPSPAIPSPPGPGRPPARRRARRRRRTSRPVPAPAGRRLGRPLLGLGLFALLALAFSGLLAPAPATRPRPEPPAGELAARAAALDALAEELAAPHRSPGGGLGEACSTRRSMGADSPTLDPRTPLRVRRLLDALAAWRRALPPEVLAGARRRAPDHPAGLARADRIMAGLLPHLFSDLEEVIELPDVIAGGWPVDRVHEAVRTRDELRGLVTELLEPEAWLAPGAAPRLAPAAASAARYATPGGALALIPGLLERAEGAPRTREARVPLLAAGLQLFRHELRRGRIACEAGTTDLARLLRAGAELEPAPVPGISLPSEVLHTLQELRGQCPGFPWWRHTLAALPLLAPAWGLPPPEPDDDDDEGTRRRDVYRDRLLRTLGAARDPEARRLEEALRVVFPGG